MSPTKNNTRYETIYFVFLIKSDIPSANGMESKGKMTIVYFPGIEIQPIQPIKADMAQNQKPKINALR